MNLQDIFVDQVNPDLVSVYIGRVISLDDNFQDNGQLYVDLVNVDSKDLDLGEKTATRATATFALRNCYNSWERPPEIKSKTQFMGSMNMTTSGDFHLRNYCFDAQTLAWFTTVSTALNAIGIVNVPPVLVGLDVTPIPGQAVSVNVAQAATEVVNEAIDDSLRDVEPKSNTKKSSTSTTSIKQPSLIEVKRILQRKNNKKALLRNTRSSDSDNPNEIIADVINKLVEPLDSILNVAFQPYFQFTECISLIFQIYKNNLNDIEEITWPITQFTNLTNSTTNESPKQTTQEALKNVLGTKIDAFKNSVTSNLPSLNNVKEIVVEALYNPLAYIYQTISDKIDDIITPIKNKITEIITTFIKPVLTDLISFISMAIQPAISSLPSFVQLIVQKALKKLLQLLLGKPIKKLLGKIIDPIENLIDSAVTSMKNKVLDVFIDAVKFIVNPIIEGIQTSIMEMIPIFNMQSMVDKLKEIADPESGVTFPDIYVGIDPLQPYKKFLDINWSDDHEIACMLQTLINDTPLAELELSTVDITTVIEEIRNNEKKKDPSVVDDSSTENENNDIEDKTIYLKKFTSKDEFMPYFIYMYPPAMKEADLSDGMFKDYGDGKKQPEVWITNGVNYVVANTGEKYIIALKDGETVKTVYPEDGEVGGVFLEKNKIYYTEEIPHIIDSDEDNENLEGGDDLVPQIVYSTDGIIPKILEIQKVNDKGELLYLAREKNPENPEEYITVEKTYDEIIVNYLQPKTLLSDINEKLKGFILGEDPNNLLQKINDHVSADPNNDEITWLNNSESGLVKQNLYLYVTNPNIYNKETEGILIIRKEIDSSTEPPSEISNRVDNVSNTFYKKIVRNTDSEDSSKEILTISIYNYNSSVPTLEFRNKIKYEFIFRRDVSTGEIRNHYSSEDVEIKYYMLSPNGTWFIADDPDQGVSTPVFTFSGVESAIDPSNLYVYVSQENTYTESVVAENFSEPEKTNETLLTMFVSAVRAIGQSGVFDSDILFDSTAKKITSVFSPIADSIDKVSSTVDSTLETLDELKNVDNMIDTIKELGDKIKDVTDKAKPAMEAVAKAASAAAIQSCSMSQAAKGKDFGFSSGDNYDLSTTTDSRLQLPYCKQLRREHLIEPNCKVLVLAVGAGKQNLYAIDILN